MRLLLTVLVLGLLAQPASAKIDTSHLGAAHFVGLWSLDGPAGCSGGDTLSIYASGAWAVTNGGDNPVEAIGTWEISEGVLRLRESPLGDRLGFAEAEVEVDSLQEGRMGITVVYGDGRRLSYQLDRCL
jgi:hypothetical protein